MEADQLLDGSTDWRTAYLKLVDQRESEEHSRAETESMLCRAIVRITLAVDGLDPNLDPCFKQLRSAVKKGVTPALRQQINGLSDSLLRAQDQEKAPSPQKDPEVILHRLLGRPRLSGKAGRKYDQLKSRIFADPGSVSDEDIDSLVGLLTSTPDRRPGLLGRLFARGENEARADEGETISGQPNGMLLALLERLSWPGQLSERVIALRDRLLDRPRDGEWVDVIEELVAGISETLGDAQAKIRDTEGFLSQLTERLGEIDSHVQGVQGDQKAALDSGRQLNASVSEEVSGIGESMRAASDLKQLQGVIHKRLDAIQSHVQMHLKGEEARFEKAQQGAKETWERLRTLEAESENLRRKIADLHRKALRDTVTHLPNRMACEDRMKQEFARWKRFQDPLTLMVWDIDNFKGINDRYGHQAGDKALRAVAKTLKKRLRETDFIGRYGGEEFVVLLPGAPQPDALRIANEMRMAIETAGFHAGSKPVAMTISCGISEFHDGDSAESVFDRADKALYAAKKDGKNRCEVA